MKEKTNTDIEPVKVSVEGTVVDWEHKTQIDATTGAVYDFAGILLVPPVVPEPEVGKPPRKKGKS